MGISVRLSQMSASSGKQVAARVGEVDEALVILGPVFVDVHDCCGKLVDDGEANAVNTLVLKVDCDCATA